MPEVRTLTLILGGEEGIGLLPLTKDLPPPALPFGGSHRLIDFVLSNLYHSELHQIYILTRHRPHVLLEHIARYWALLPHQADGFITPLLPSRALSDPVACGTVGALYECLDLISRHAPDLVAVVEADQIYRMDFRRMISFHLECGADVSVAARATSLRDNARPVVIRADQNQRIRKMQHHSPQPDELSNKAGRMLVSTGNYLFRPAVLMEGLAEAVARGEGDLGRHVLPRWLDARRTFVYDVSSNIVPGRAPYEDAAYWREIDSIDSYAAAHMDLMGARPRFRLDNPEWPVLGRMGSKNTASHSILGPASVATGAVLRRSVLQAGVTVESGARVERCIIMDGTTIRKRVHLRNTIVGASNVIKPGTRIGYDPGRDRLRFPVTSTGIVVIPPLVPASS